MQNAGFAALGLNWRYLAFDVPPASLSVALAGAKGLGFIGLNLTVPHKLLAVSLVDALDESARAWEAVNTIRFEGRADDGSWQPLCGFETPPAAVRAVGFNTDAEAITRALREDLHFEPHGGSALVVGTGGAGRVAALKLAADGVARLHLVNRTLSKAEVLAGEIARRYPAVQVEVGYPVDTVDLLLNATSLGLKPDDPLPVDLSRFALSRADYVYDMIYRPAETPLLRTARAAGCRAANGLGMLLYQGASALEIWTGQPAPVAVMRRALEANVYGG